MAARLTDAEIQEIIALRRQGLSLGEIGRRTGRASSACTYVLQRHCPDLLPPPTTKPQKAYTNAERAADEAFVARFRNEDHVERVRRWDTGCGSAAGACADEA